MDNKTITKILKLTIQLMELHEENSFKIRSYQSAVNTIDRDSLDLAGLDKEELLGINGIGKSIAEVILAIQETASHPYLEELLSKTPSGLLEVLQIKGLGPKKVRLLWQDLHITSTHELMEACRSGKVAATKGFGEKTQEGIIKALEFQEFNSDKWLYADIEEEVEKLQEILVEKFGKDKVVVTGDYARKMEIIDQLDWLIETGDAKRALETLTGISNLENDPKSSSPYVWRGKLQSFDLKTQIHFTKPGKFVQQKLIRTASRAHLLSPANTEGPKTLAEVFLSKPFENEEEAYQEAGLDYIFPELREGHFEIELAKTGKLPVLLEEKDLKGILHNHSTYSDGKHSLKEMASYCQSLGYEYLGISDHSKTAFYAGGLDEDRVKAQQEEIQKLNREMAPFRIFSGIESDILIDGSLDYDEKVLASFDFIVASVHSSLNMDSQKATSRLLKAIQNPYTTILGHPTGRLLLRREGYPINHKAIIDACAVHDVVIEINANPWRLDLDWRWVNYAIEKGVKLSVNPDAHEKEGYADMKYGVLAGRKGGLTREMTLNALSLEEIAGYFENRKSKLLKK